ncbi:MAG: aminotransferase class IV [Candidatus Sumerlaeota bacterium]|nr:aminotransferase class IV [Candidatus Sumerlaeota bacterium]
MDLVSLNGIILPAAEARVSALDRGMLFGDGLFETLRVEKGEPLLFREHLDRLWEGLAFLRIVPSLDREALEAAAREYLGRLGYRSARLRITVTRGRMRSDHPVGRFADPHEATVLLAASALPAMPFPARVRCSLVEEIRRDPRSPLSMRKTLNYLPSLVAREIALGRGADEAILTDTRGRLSEAAMANLFWLRGDRLYRPSDGCGALRGVTAALAQRVAAQAGFEARPIEAEPREWIADDLLFLTNAIWGMARVVSLDNLEFRPSAETENAFQGLLERFLCEYPIG